MSLLEIKRREISSIIPGKNTEMQDDLRSQTNAEEKHDQYNTEKNDMQSTQTQTAPKEEEDNEPKPWDEYFNSL